MMIKNSNKLQKINYNWLINNYYKLEMNYKIKIIKY